MEQECLTFLFGFCSSCRSGGDQRFVIPDDGVFVLIIVFVIRIKFSSTATEKKQISYQLK